MLRRARDPFSLTADPRMYVPRASTEAALDELADLLRAGESTLRLAGPPGLGKTLLLHLLPERLGSSWRCAYLGYPKLSVDDLWIWVAEHLGLGQPTEEAATLVASKVAAKGGGLVLMIDDAQSMPDETLRLLAGVCAREPGLRVVLAATCEPSEHRQPGEVRLVDTLTEEETEAYLLGRLERSGMNAEDHAVFAGLEFERLHELTEGVPARIHYLATAIQRGDSLPAAERASILSLLPAAIGSRLGLGSGEQRRVAIPSSRSEVLASIGLLDPPVPETASNPPREESGVSLPRSSQEPAENKTVSEAAPTTTASTSVRSGEDAAPTQAETASLPQGGSSVPPKPALKAPPPVSDTEAAPIPLASLLRRDTPLSAQDTPEVSSAPTIAAAEPIQTPPATQGGSSDVEPEARSIRSGLTTMAGDREAIAAIGRELEQSMARSQPEPKSRKADPGETRSAKVEELDLSALRTEAEEEDVQEAAAAQSAPEDVPIDLLWAELEPPSRLAKWRSESFLSVWGMAPVIAALLGSIVLGGAFYQLGAWRASEPVLPELAGSEMKPSESVDLASREPVQAAAPGAEEALRRFGPDPAPGFEIAAPSRSSAAKALPEVGAAPPTTTPASEFDAVEDQTEVSATRRDGMAAAAASLTPEPVVSPGPAEPLRTAATGVSQLPESPVQPSVAPVVDPETAVAPPPPTAKPEVALAPAPSTAKPEVALTPQPFTTSPEVALAPERPAVSPEVALAPARPEVIPEVALAPERPAVSPEVALAPERSEVSPEVALAPAPSAGIDPLETDVGLQVGAARVTEQPPESVEVRLPRVEVEAPEAVPSEPVVVETEAQLPAEPLVSERGDPTQIAVNETVNTEALANDRIEATSVSAPVSSRVEQELDLTDPDVRAPEPVAEVERVSPPAPTGRLSVNARPWAEIEIDGKIIGETPLGEIELPHGRHQVIAHFPSGATVTETVVVGEKEKFLVLRPSEEGDNAASSIR